MLTRKVKVLKETNSPSWSNKYIGEEFDVVDCYDQNRYYVVENGGVTNKTLPKNICEKIIDLSERQGILDTIKIKVIAETDLDLAKWTNEHLGEEFLVIKDASYEEYYTQITNDRKIGWKSFDIKTCEIVE